MEASKGSQSVIADVLDGVIAGLVATWLMGKATTYLYEREGKVTRKQEDDARGGKTAYGIAAEKAAHMAGIELSDDERKKYGSQIHWALGVGAGAAYGLLRHRLPASQAARGLAFGTAFWLLFDEGATTALGLTPPPNKFPLQTHARGLAGHLVFGAAADAALGVLQPPT
jgi:uncharacterized membrane protein YagU involved in acid resistance